MGPPRGTSRGPAMTTPTHIRDLVPDPHNRRKHNPRNIGLIADTLQDVGFARSVVIDENDCVLAGNGVLAAAAEVGMTKVLTVETDGTTLVAVRRRGLTEAQKRTLAVADNRTAELAEWNLEQLQADLDAGLSLEPWFRPEESAALLAQLLPPFEASADDLPAVRSTEIRPGDIFALGRHRLVCGDSRRQETRDAVMAGTLADGMWTDPPYGVNYVGKTSEALVVHGDGEADLVMLLRDAFAVANGALKPGAAIYVAHPAGRNAVVFAQAFLAAGWHFHEVLVWIKDTLVMGHSDYHYQHEPILYGWKTGATRTWLSDRTKVTIFAIDRPKASPDHPTTKPVQLVIQQIRNNVASGGLVFDPFCGSGTTLIAAEQLGLSCRAIELSPAYCQVILDRFEQFSGERALKFGEVAHA